jgi:predicted metallo-beta-lactamase superfamily hydrolase
MIINVNEIETEISMIESFIAEESNKTILDHASIRDFNKYLTKLKTSYRRKISAIRPYWVTQYINLRSW